jgi:hypothetical protein
VTAGLPAEHAPLEAVLLQGVRGVRVRSPVGVDELAADEQPLPADVDDPGVVRRRLPQSAADGLPEVACVSQEVVLPDVLDSAGAGPHRDDVPAVGSGVVARPPRVEVLAVDRRRQREAGAAERLRRRHHVGRHVVPLARPPPTGAPEPALDLVEHQRDAVVVGDVAEAL